MGDAKWRKIVALVELECYFYHDATQNRQLGE